MMIPRIYFTDWFKDDPKSVHILVYLYFSARWTQETALFGNKTITLEPGQLITKIADISRNTLCPIGCVKRRLTSFRNMSIIDVISDRNGLLITLNYYKVDNEEKNKSDRNYPKRVPNGPKSDRKRILTTYNADSEDELKIQKKKNTQNRPAPPNPPPPPGPDSPSPPLEEGADCVRWSAEGPTDLSLGQIWFDWAKGESKNPPRSWSPESFAREIRINRAKSDVTPEAMLDFIRESPFWAKNALSPAALRKRNSSGVMKLDTIAKQMVEKAASDPPKVGSPEWNRIVFGDDDDDKK